MSPRLVALAIALTAAACLAGCGKTSDLARPQPLFGHPSDSHPQTETRQQAAVRARADADRAVADDDAPQSIEELRDYDMPGHDKKAPATTAKPLDPGAAQPQGDSKDPSATPQASPQ